MELSVLTEIFCVCAIQHNNCRAHVAIEHLKLTDEAEELDLFILFHFNPLKFKESHVASSYVLGSTYLDIITNGDNYKKDHFKNNYR